MRRAPWVRVPILNDEYAVIVMFGDLKTLKKCMRYWDYPPKAILLAEEGIKGRGACFWANGCHPLIYMRRKPKTPEEWGTLAHESVHAIEHVLDSIGEEPRNEIMAHSAGAIVRIAGKWRPGKK